jgi:8-oxo-dGTP pyrophosphatase MutT (NUDIX family)
VDDPVSLERIRDALARAPATAPPDAGGAAVAVILRERSGEAEVLLIRRAAREGDPWSGQMGLPGGHREPDDDGLVATATRETREEVGLDLETHGRLLGALPAVPMRPQHRGTRMTVTPFVFEVVGDSAVRAGSEVEEALWTALHPLARHEHDTIHAFLRDGVTTERPAWNVGGRVVWGLTYEMLRSLLDTLPASGTAGAPAGG